MSHEFSGYLLDEFIDRLKYLRGIAGNVPVCVRIPGFAYRFESAAVEIQNVVLESGNNFVSLGDNNTDQIISIF